MTTSLGAAACANVPGVEPLKLDPTFFQHTCYQRICQASSSGEYLTIGYYASCPMSPWSQKGIIATTMFYREVSPFELTESNQFLKDMAKASYEVLWNANWLMTEPVFEKLPKDLWNRVFHTYRNAIKRCRDQAHSDTARQEKESLLVELSSHTDLECWLEDNSDMKTVVTPWLPSIINCVVPANKWFSDSSLTSSCEGFTFTQYSRDSTVKGKRDGMYKAMSKNSERLYHIVSLLGQKSKAKDQMDAKDMIIREMTAYPDGRAIAEIAQTLLYSVRNEIKDQKSSVLAVTMFVFCAIATKGATFRGVVELLYVNELDLTVSRSTEGRFLCSWRSGSQSFPQGNARTKIYAPGVFALYSLIITSEWKINLKSVLMEKLMFMARAGSNLRRSSTFCP
eukprot:GHVS01105403.1.p1 GENE.GHVS01105403.1~~GHVS01105403.1.p1  ORF type:complete len:396 (+),score=5.20 GHVS01105403.1:381-1568(+)